MTKFLQTHNMATISRHWSINITGALDIVLLGAISVLSLLTHVDKQKLHVSKTLTILLHCSVNLSACERGCDKLQYAQVEEGMLTARQGPGSMTPHAATWTRSSISQKSITDYTRLYWKPQNCSSLLVQTKQHKCRISFNGNQADSLTFKDNTLGFVEWIKQ